ncbi:MAG: BMP family ABC transporter substrate-binding protein [Bifidobacteriaceae bacterium]|jgi:basic membrane protein A|nr:BMP family ABC transporter substrate-binding protein [Bifidobacteriaceae bacterium]
MTHSTRPSRILARSAAVAAIALALAGCGGSAPPEASPPDVSPLVDQAGESDFLACMVLDAGGFDDKSFNQSGYEGLVEAQAKFGIGTKTAESASDADFAPNLDMMVSNGCDLTFSIGALLVEATQRAASIHHDAHFAMVDDNSIDAPGVKPLGFRTSEASYLAGYAAAAQTRTGTVATFGGMQIPAVTIFMDGFVQGVAKYNADKGADVTVLGWNTYSQTGSFCGDFTDTAKGETLTKSLISQGADIIMPVAGPVGLGAVAAAKAAGDVAIVWVDADGYETNPEDSSLFLTSVVKHIGAAVSSTIAETIESGFSNEPYLGTLANGGVDIAEFHDFDSQVSDQTKAELLELREGIISGEIEISSPSDP